MKKILIPVVLVASSLVFFSFKPMTKSADVKAKAIKVAPTQGSTCDKYNATHPDKFVSCYTVSTPTTPSPEPVIILAKY